MTSLADFAILAAGLTDVNPGLTFWTIVTFLALFFVLRWKAWGPILKMVEEREKAIQDAIGAAKRERQEAEKLLGEQKHAIAEARRESAELVKRNQAEVEKVREELLQRSRKESEELVAQAKRQIEDEKTKAISEVRGHAVDLAVQITQRLLDATLDEAKQKELASKFAKELEAGGPPRA